MRGDGHAQKFQQPLRDCGTPAESGPDERTLVRVLQSEAEPIESFVLGWNGTLDFRKAIGEGGFQLADWTGGLCTASSRRLVDDIGRIGILWGSIETVVSKR